LDSFWHVFFPISGVCVNPSVVFSVGLVGGFVSGFFGVGCGIVITPFLMEIGIPPSTALATQLTHAVGTNLTNFLAYKRKQDVDFRLALYVLLGGVIGAIGEWYSIKYFHEQSAIFNKFAYIYIGTLVFLGSIMLYQSIRTIFRVEDNLFHQTFSMRRWMLYLPFHAIFKRSRVEMSILVPIFVGVLTGLVVASLGGGNSLLMAPMLTYLIGRISPVVQGTASLTGFVIAALIAFVYAERGHYCDLGFVMILFTGGSVGSWLGVKLAYKIPRYWLNGLAAAIIFAMAARLAFRVMSTQPIVVETFGAEESRRSLIFQIAEQNSMLYTFSCVLFVSTFALLSEFFFHKILRKKKHRKVKRR
jgi:uncharacterized membrane protein YfcA